MALITIVIEAAAETSQSVIRAAAEAARRRIANDNSLHGAAVVSADFAPVEVTEPKPRPKNKSKVVEPVSHIHVKVTSTSEDEPA